MDPKILNEVAKRQFRTEAHFEVASVVSEAESGYFASNQGGRPHARESLGTNARFSSRSGDRVITLTSTRYDLPQPVANSAWITG